MAKQSEELESRDSDKRLAAIEQLIIDQTKINKKTMRTSRICAIALVVILVLAVISFGLLITLYTPLKSTVDELPDLVAAVETLTKVTEEGVVEVMEELQTIDFDAINQTIEDVSNIKFNELNRSIEDLQSGVQSFKNFMDAFNVFG